MHLEIVKIALGNLNKIASRMSMFLNVLAWTPYWNTLITRDYFDYKDLAHKEILY